MQSNGNFFSTEFQMMGEHHSFYLNRIYGYEALSTPFHFQLTVSSFDSVGNLKQYLGTQVLFKVGDREWHGYITELKQSKPIRNVMQYCLAVKPWTALMNSNLKSRIFKNMNSLDVVSYVLNEENFAFYRIRCQREYIRPPCIIQYQENNFQFISRLLTNANIFYYFVYENERHIMILMDDPIYLPVIESKFLNDFKAKRSDKQKLNIIYGKSFSIQLRPGYRISNKSYFITRVVHSAHHHRLSSMLFNDFYYNYYQCHELNTYYVFPKPKLMIGGHQCAKVVRLNEKQLSIDQRCCVGITFPWDTHQTLVWASLVQGQAGNQYGHQWLPRAGEQVWVMFYEGDPHRPFIVSSVIFNKKSKNDFHITSNSSFDSKIMPKRYNQIIFDKTKKAASMSLHAARDLYWQSNGSIKQLINRNWFLQSKEGDVNVNVENADVTIQAHKSIVLTVGESTIHVTEKEIKISSPKIVLQNSSTSPAISAARIDDPHLCPRMTAKIPHQGGYISSGASSVLINGKGAARMGDLSPCAILVDKVISGAPKILFEGRQAARLNDKMQHGGKISGGSTNVQIGNIDNNKSSVDQTKTKKEKFYFKINWKY